MVPLVAAGLLLAKGVIQVPGLDDSTILQYAFLAAALGLVFYARWQLRCPSCAKAVWPVDARACPHCGQVLAAHQPGSVRVAGTPGAVASVTVDVSLRRLAALDRWSSRSERVLWKLALVLPLLPIAFLAVGIEHRGLSSFLVTAAWTYVLLGLGVFFLGWFFILYVPEHLLRLVFWTLEARCPRCQKRFATDVGFGAGHLEARFPLPERCAGCGAQFRFTHDSTASSQQASKKSH